MNRNMLYMGKGDLPVCLHGLGVCCMPNGEYRPEEAGQTLSALSQ